ncbi:uncharacterized protein V3H82_013288 [Fundulus diaphanus]
MTWILQEFFSVSKWTRVLVFIILPFCAYESQATNEVFSEQEAEENQTIKLNLPFTASTSKSLSISCRRSTDQKVLYHYHTQKGVVVSEHQDEQFAGRVCLDNNAPWKGPIVLVVSRLRTEDSGLYNCTFKDDADQTSHTVKLHIYWTIDVDVTQSSYLAEKDNNITLEWTFTTTPDCSSDVSHIFCVRVNDSARLYETVAGVVVSQFHGEQFLGRVQCDEDVLRKGRLRLHVSNLKIEDSGVYNCKVKIGNCLGSKRCALKVIDSLSSMHHYPTTATPPPENQSTTSLLYKVLSPGIIIITARVMVTSSRFL